MKIGIFLGYGPQVKLGKEGLGRYLAGLLKGFEEQGQQITIACPKWLLGTLFELFKDFQIDRAKINWITTKRNPVLWKVQSLFHKKTSRRNRLTSVIKYIRATAYTHIKKVAKTNSIFVFSCYICLLIIVGITTLPFIIIGGLLVGLLLLIKKIVARVINIAKVYIKELLMRDASRKNIYNKRAQLQTMVKEIFSDVKTTAYYAMSDAALDTLIKRINKEQKQDVWFVPAVFWPQVNRIQSTVVINVPDLVSEMFPASFADVFGSAEAIKRCRETILGGRCFITYCEYIRQSLLTEEYGKPLEGTIAIPHVDNDMRSYLSIDPLLCRQIQTNKDLDLEYAKSVLYEMGQNAQPNDYMRGIDLRHVKYFFYASQARPSKNMLNLIKAYEYLLHRRYIGHKLFLTCDLKKDNEIYEYIEEHSLGHDIISFFNIPAMQLAVLYKCADLVVNPTLYEGGFPFTFGEGMSVGTPSIMSDIPQVREIFEPAGLEDCMFDPYDWMNIAQKIEHGILEREDILARQMPLYNELRKRTTDLVASEYIQKFMHFRDVELNIRAI